MAALDFPTSPSVGTRYPLPAVAGKTQYVWDGEKWTTAALDTTVAPPATALPLMDAATAVVGITTKYAREDHVHPKIYAAPFDAMAYNGMQVNGSFEVAQENGTATVTVQNTTKYILDQWRVGCANSAGILSCKQQAPGTGMPGMALELAATTAFTTIGANDFAAISLPIEGYRIGRLCWGTAAAQSVTLGFWVNTLVAGVASLCIQNDIGSPTRSYVANFTTSAGVWEYKTITIPGCPDGTWNKNNLIGCCVSWVFAAGASFISGGGFWQIGAAGGGIIATSANTNYFATTNNKVTISNVVVLPGIEAPSAERSPLIMRPYDQELVTCKRYWEARNMVTTTSTSTVLPTGFWEVEKRAAPTLAWSFDVGTGATYQPMAFMSSAKGFYQNIAHSQIAQAWVKADARLY